MKALHRHYLLFIQALLALLGSLYYGFFGDPIVNLSTGEFFWFENGFTPCELCRYARLLIYPISIISLIGIIRENWTYVYSVLPLSIIAIFLELYHYTLQKTDIVTSTRCTRNNPCEALTVDYFWFMTIPFLCLIAAVVITISAWMIIRANKK